MSVNTNHSFIYSTGMAATNQEYETLMQALGYFSASGEHTVGLIRGEQLRDQSSQTNGDQLFDRRFRYASVLDSKKLGVTDIFEINGAPCIYLKSLSADPTPDELHA